MTIPRGNDGINGTNGSTPVFSSTTTTSTLSAGSSATASISGSGTSSNPYKFSFGIPRGNTGSQGPTGPSAISKSNLTTAGYIIFLNNFGIQWTNYYNTTITTITATLPISFNSTTCTASIIYNDSSAVIQANSFRRITLISKTKSDITIDALNYPVLIMAIGY